MGDSLSYTSSTSSIANLALAISLINLSVNTEPTKRFILPLSIYTKSRDAEVNNEEFVRRISAMFRRRKICSATAVVGRPIQTTCKDDLCPSRMLLNGTRRWRRKTPKNQLPGKLYQQQPSRTPATHSRMGRRTDPQKPTTTIPLTWKECF